MKDAGVPAVLSSPCRVPAAKCVFLQTAVISAAGGGGGAGPAGTPAVASPWGVFPGVATAGVLERIPRDPRRGGVASIGSGERGRLRRSKRTRDCSYVREWGSERHRPGDRLPDRRWGRGSVRGALPALRRLDGPVRVFAAPIGRGCGGCGPGGLSRALAASGEVGSERDGAGLPLRCAAERDREPPQEAACARGAVGACGGGGDRGAAERVEGRRSGPGGGAGGGDREGDRRADAALPRGLSARAPAAPVVCRGGRGDGGVRQGRANEHGTRSRC